MDVRLTEEQQMVRQLGADLAAAHAPGSVAALLEAGDADRAWRAVADAGLLALPVPTSLGGAGGSAVVAALVAEQLAGSTAPLPYVGAGTWAPALLAAVGAADVVGRIAAGSERLAPVLTVDLGRLARAGEAGVAFDARGATAGIVLDGDGRLRTIELGPPTSGVDVSRALRRVPASAAVGERLGDRRLAPDGARRTDALALTVLAADLLGTMQRALDDAVDHVRERVQFGVPVGSFQAVQHLAAHGLVLVEGTRSSTWHAAWAVDALEPEAAVLAGRQAKAYASAAAREVGELAIQLLGGIGLTWEHPAHVRQRRILLTRQVLGAEGAQHAAIAEARLGTVG